MNAPKPKQYLSIHNKTILEHSLERLLLCPLVAAIVVAVAQDDEYWSTLAISQNKRVHTITGGAERADSVLCGLNFLQDKIQADDFIWVHDAARPCITHKLLHKLHYELHSHAVGGILALPVSDTLKQVDQSQDILRTVDRTQLWQAQTPQMYRYGLLKNCLTKGLAEKCQITDEASAVEIYGYSSKVVEGSRDNIKITRPEDLKLAEFIFSQQIDSQN